MFIGTLSLRQQAYFLTIAKTVIAADGTISDSEKLILATLTAECSPGVEPMEDLSSVSADTLFDDRESQVSFMLELIGVALADTTYDDSEKAIIHNLAETFGLSQVLLEDMENWVSRQMTLVHEARLMMLEG